MPVLFLNPSPPRGKVQKEHGIILIPLLPGRRIQNEHGIIFIPLPQWGRGAG
jgi:hypothetical protein